MGSEHSGRSVWITLIIHLVLTSLVFGFLFFASGPQEQRDALTDAFMVIGTLASVTGMIFSVWVTLVSQRAEAALRESLELTRKSTSSQTHLFDSFSEHISWIEEHLAPSKFSNRGVHLHLALSTFSYGIGVLEQELSQNPDSFENCSPMRFCRFLEAWISQLESRPATADPCIIDISLWEQSERKSVFDNTTALASNVDPKVGAARTKLLDSFRKLASRLVDLRANSNVRLSIYYSNKSDSRLFLARDRMTFHGLMAVFTPLSESAIHHAGWRLCGLSVNDEQGYKQLVQFFTHLSRRNHDPNLLHEDLAERFRTKHELVEELIAASTSSTATTSSTLFTSTVIAASNPTAPAVLASVPAPPKILSRDRAANRGEP